MSVLWLLSTCSLLLSYAQAVIYDKFTSDTQIFTKSGSDLGYSSTNNKFTLTVWVRRDQVMTTKASILQVSDFNIDLESVDLFELAFVPTSFVSIVGLINVDQSSSQQLSWSFVGLSYNDPVGILCITAWGVTPLVCQSGGMASISLSKYAVMSRSFDSPYLGELYDLRLSASSKTTAQLTSQFTGTVCYANCLGSCIGPSASSCSSFISLVSFEDPIFIADTDYLEYEKTEAVFRGLTYTNPTNLGITGWIYTYNIASKVNWCNLVWLKNRE
jgi:hypothetical protein